MQSDKNIQNLVHSEAFQKLVRKKSRMSFFLSAVVLLVYCLYFIAIAWFPEWMGSVPGTQSIISIGIWFTVFCVIFGMLISAFYIWWANNYFDNAMQKLLQDSSHADQ